MASSEAGDDGAFFEAVDGGPAADGEPDAAFGRLDAIYCISLQEQPERKAEAVAHFQNVGLGPVTFYRPRRGLHPPRAIWASHREVARRALEMGHRRVLILEDDARMLVGAQGLRDRLERAFSTLPTNWRGLFVGHFPIQAYPIALGLLRTRSVLAFAYVANHSLLEWLASSEPMDPTVSVCVNIGDGIDAAFANQPDMYALFPMAAHALDTGHRRIDCERPRKNGLAMLADRVFYRNFFIFHGVRPAQALAMLCAPWNALTLEYFRRRSGRAIATAARDLLARGFDGRAYLLANPDVAASGQEPLSHYLRAGVREGRDPFPPLVGFEPEAYLDANPDVRATGMAPAMHYLDYGRAEGRALRREADR